jgi:DICT domain-containing protein
MAYGDTLVVRLSITWPVHRRRPLAPRHLFFYAQRVPDHLRATRRLTKTTLVTMSHAIERAGLATAEDGPMLVLALFQRRPYFDREAAVYQELATRAAATVVGVVGRPAGPPPAGVELVELDEQEALAREWSVVVLTPRFGAVLVARDLEQVDPGARTLEAGRLFDSWWRLRRDDALHEALRLRRMLGSRLSDRSVRAVDAVLDRVREVPAAAGESRAEAATRLMATAIDDGHTKIRALRTRLDGLHAEVPVAGARPDVPGTGFLRDWTSGGGTTASGTLPVALIGVRVTQTDSVPRRAGRSSGGPEMVGVLQVLQDARQPVDRVVRLDADEFLLVMPSRSFPDAIATAHHIVRATAGLAGQFPFVAIKAHCIVTVTRQRPLPTDELRMALASAVEQDIVVATFTDDHPLHPTATAGHAS